MQRRGTCTSVLKRGYFKSAKNLIKCFAFGLVYQKPWMIRLWLVCYLSEGSVSVPFSVSLELQFADNLKSIQIETMTYGKINWRNTSFNISSISRRLPPSSNALGSMNYFNWFIHYHVTELSGGGGEPSFQVMAIIHRTAGFVARRYVAAG